jgi:hypothetical protein
MHGCGEVALVKRSVIVLAKEGLQFGSGRHGPARHLRAEATADGKPSPGDPGRPGSRRPGAVGHRKRAVVLGAAAPVASITTCSLSWPAAVSCACTSRFWRRRSRWPGLAPVGSQVKSPPGPPWVIKWPGSVARHQVFRVPGSATGVRYPCGVFAVGAP